MRTRRRRLLTMKGLGNRAGSRYSLFRLCHSADIYVVSRVETCGDERYETSLDAFPSASDAVAHMTGEVLAGIGGG